MRESRAMLALAMPSVSGLDQRSTVSRERLRLYITLLLIIYVIIDIYSVKRFLLFSLVIFVILLLCYSILPKFFWQRQIGEQSRGLDNKSEQKEQKEQVFFRVGRGPYIII